MSVLAGKACLPFESKMVVDLGTVAKTETPESMRPELGPLSQLAYKPTKLRYLVRLSGVPTAGSISLKLKAANAVVVTEVFDVAGRDVVAGVVSLSLSGVAGEAPLSVEIDVATAADAGITATVDAVLDIEQPLILSGC